MRKLITILRNYNVPETDGDIGVEIEVEGENLPQPNEDCLLRNFTNFWNIVKDGSLRGEAWEYVFKRPASRETYKRVLSYFTQQMEDKGSRFHDSVRAGIHIHINVQNLTVKELFNFLVTYYIMEEYIINRCGEGRQGNLFCLRSQDAPYILFSLYRAFRDNSCQEIATDLVRYSSLNVISLFKYGSLEFRALRTTPDMKIIS